MTGRAFRLLALSLGLALLVWIVISLGWREILAMVVASRWTFAGAVVLYAGHQAARAWALTACVPAGRALGYRDALTVRLSGEAVQFLTFSGPVLAEPAKAWLLGRRGLTAWEGLATTLAEYLASSAIAALMAIAGLAYALEALDLDPAARRAAIAVLVGMAIFLALLVVGIAARVHIIGGVVRLAARAPVLRDRLAGRLAGLPAAENMLIAVLRDRPRRVATIALIETLGQICLVLELWILLTPIARSLDVGLPILIEGATKFITAGFFFVPGQVGVSEGTYAAIFAAFGLPAAAGVAVSFIRRLRSMLTAAIGLWAMARLSESEVA